MKMSKDWAKEVSKELGLEYSDVLKMTMAEVNTAQEKKFMQIVMDNKNNDVRTKRLKLLIPEFDYYYNIFGESFLMAFAYRDSDTIFEWTDKQRKNIDYENQEIKSLLTREVEDSGYSYYSRNKKFLRLRDFNYLNEIIEDAIGLRFPNLIKYAPSIYGYGAEWKEASITFTIRRGEPDENGYTKKDYFKCTMETLLSGDIDMMIEDYLEDIGFSKCKSRDDDKFKETNEFMSCNEMKQFIFDIKESFKNI